jgi:TetR/AcrR family transcriptional repressor of mexJK operon
MPADSPLRAHSPLRADSPLRAGRPKSAAKRGAILETAQKRFTHEPQDRVSLEAIAIDAGVSKATICSHFPNKDALFIAAISAGCEAIFARANSAADSGPVEDALFQLGRDVLEMIFDPEMDRPHAVILLGNL